MNQRKTPLFDQLVKHAGKEPTSFHVPGHKNGTVFLNRASAFYKNILELDVTEIKGMDDLHHPTGVIKEAETLTSQLYGTRSSHFLIGGSTVGNLTMIMGTVEEGDTILIQRNCHKSVFHAAELSGAKPVYLEVEVDEITGLTLGVSLATIKQAVEKCPEAKAIVLTNPSYEGYGQDLHYHINIAHSANMIVIVDEAHGPHLLFNDSRWPKTSLYAGADLVVQSAHKMLPAMTMTSFLHINSQRVDEKKILRLLTMLQSSSPSYPLLASLDIARAYLAEVIESGGQKKLTEQLFDFKSKLSSGLNWIQAPHYIGNYVQDPLKVALITTDDSITGYDLQEKLEAVEIYPELASPNHLLLTMPLKLSDLPLNKWAQQIGKALKTDSTSGTIDIKKSSYHIKKQIKNLISEPEFTLNEVDRLPKKDVPWSKSINEVSAETITPYPPGIPLILKGERITYEKLERLKVIINNNVNLQTGDAWKQRGISVVKYNRDEENDL